MLHFCACGRANSSFMSGLRMRRRRKDAFLGCQRISCQRSGAALPFDCFDCAPGRGNYLQAPAARHPVPTLDHPNDEDLSLGTPKPQEQERGEGGAPEVIDLEHLSIGLEWGVGREAHATAGQPPQRAKTARWGPRPGGRRYKLTSTRSGFAATATFRRGPGARWCRLPGRSSRAC